MTAFLVLAIALTLAVLALLLRPLWRSSRNLALGIAATVAISTLALYQLVGTPTALDAQALAMPPTLDDAIVQLEAQLDRDPKQPDGWRLLGQAYTTEQRFADAREAYAKAVALAPRDADVLVEAAQARAMAASERRFDDAAIALLQRALQAQPQHQRARWFLGIAQRQAGKHADAAKTWESLLPQVDARTAATLRPQIDAARTAAGLPPLPAPAAATGDHTITVKVQLDPDLASRVRLRHDSNIFVIARIPSGPPMPVAVEKHSVQELPFTATLDDGDSPMPTQKLSSLQEVEVIARLSGSGNAMPQEGDLESAPVRVRLPATAPVELTIGNMRE
ncbi:tetratricopeptide repeat protein [Lysobacter sp. CFH 32150]|uniref:tetratricopeptide repeat protein n=1 Tax=Lysobacter sp. CFH 32150 TaxID=2927128 RepID=UPI001FA7DF64|nr:tetratricopeptide repeat protein [Lysobacter sp. CFH 32150]MCI4567198.1 tetratricopeptide repeat protein [Lysobacter sp. CFH 32150]